jgi:hypothetical protein
MHTQVDFPNAGATRERTCQYHQSCPYLGVDLGEPLQLASKLLKVTSLALSFRIPLAHLAASHLQLVQPAHDGHNK